MRLRNFAILLTTALMLLGPALAEAQKGGGGRGGGGQGRGGGGGGGQARSGGGGGGRSFQGGGGGGRSFQGGGRSNSGNAASSFQGGSNRATARPGTSNRPSFAAPSRQAPNRPDVQRSAPRTTTRDFVNRSGNATRDAQRAAQSRTDAARRQVQQNTARMRDDSRSFVRQYTRDGSINRPTTRPGDADRDRNRYTTGYRGDRDTWNRDRDGRDWDRDRDGNRDRDVVRDRDRDWDRDRDRDWDRDRDRNWDRDRDRDWDRNRDRYRFARRYDHDYWRTRSYFFGFGSPFGRYLAYPWWFGGYGNRFGFYPGYGYGYGYGGYGVPGYYTYQPSYAYYPGGYYDDSGYIASAPATTQAMPAPDEERLDASLDFAGQGEVAFREGRYDEAAQLWRHALVDDPTNGAIVLLLSQALFQTGEWEEAAGSLQQAARMLPEERWGTVVEHYQELYGSVQDYTDQLKKLEQARTSDPESAPVRFLLGYHFGYLGYPQQSVRELNVLLDLAPKDEVGQKLRDMMSAKLEGNRQPQAASF